MNNSLLDEVKGYNEEYQRSLTERNRQTAEKAKAERERCLRRNLEGWEAELRGHDSFDGDYASWNYYIRVEG